MSPTSSLDRAGQDATSGAAPSDGASMGSGGDDRPSENISIDFSRIDDKSSGVQDTGNGTDGGDRPTEEIGFSFTKPPEPKPAMASSPESGGADDFVLHPGAAGGEESSGLLDFSGIGDDARGEGEDFLTFDAPAGAPPEGDSATLSAFEAAHADPTGDRIEDVVAAPRPVADDFIA
ncbi:hypothetical protein KHC23_04170 [Ancylobacter dichloromethanicus]|uniref:Uncharacterized protein n=1 Tax=Ancylobacter dichloromethanicus TaxID=518825 RepID=A0A9W6JCG1_9HYPH|nr:hypothetical protein [Ancylobacter dichloromethanicus]MBS7552854.1 hypothetical protein [Ancylobacter dichloromethanicus]GLK73219.1 hypothetical protein GCM10017643_33360 [Ancylobacter dichloromethanicus]